MTQQLKKIGEYKLIKRIGKGATSQVFEAKKDGSHQQYAIKMIRLKGLNQAQKQIVTKQINIIKSISHKNIVKLLQTFQTTNNQYLVFQYCQRGDLQKYLSEYYGSQLPEQTAQTIIYCIADAVSLIHSKNITHRDIKLANILLKKDYQIKLADFGLAKQQTQKMFMQTYCGSLITMAPQIMRNKPYDKKVDVWSLGVITFQLIYGKLPFSTAQGLTKFITYVAEQPLEIPSQPPMSQVFKQLLLRSLQKNPQKRYNIKQFLANKWVQEGSQNTSIQGGMRKKLSVQQFLRSVSQQIKPQQTNSGQIQILVAQRVNKLIVDQMHKIIKNYQQIRQNLLNRVQGQQSMKNLLNKLDFSYVQFIKKLPIKIGKQSSTQVIKCSQLHGIQFPKTLSTSAQQSDTAGNIIYKYLQKTTQEGLKLQQKLKIYQLGYDFLQLLYRFQIRVIVLFANHLYEEFEIGNVINNIKQKKINQQIKQQIQYTKGNYITLAMQCQDKDIKMKNIRDNLRKNIMKRIDQIKKQIGGY